MNEVIKKSGAALIIGTIFLGLSAIVPPVFNTAKFVWDMSTAHSSTNHRINKLELEALKTEKGLKDFRAIWCVDRLSYQDRTDSRVIETCTKWIRGE